MRNLLFIFAFAISICSCDFKSARDYYDEALDLESNEKYKEAILLLDKSLEKDDKFLPAYINRAEDKFDTGDINGAISDCKKVISINPKHTLAYYCIGNYYTELKNYKLSIEYYKKAMDTKGGQNVFIDKVPNDFIDEEFEYDVPAKEILFNRGVSYYHVDSLRKSFYDFKYCVSKEFLLADSYSWLGYIYMRDGKKELACENFEKAGLYGYKNTDKEVETYCK